VVLFEKDQQTPNEEELESHETKPPDPLAAAIRLLDFVLDLH
jgi:hypothetical protein